jgi:hypothetical protein
MHILSSLANDFLLSVKMLVLLDRTVLRHNFYPHQQGVTVYDKNGDVKFTIDKPIILQGWRNEERL